MEDLIKAAAANAAGSNDPNNPPTPAPQGNGNGGGQGPDEETERKARIEALKLEEDRMIKKVADARKAARGEHDGDLLEDVNQGNPPKKSDVPNDNNKKSDNLDPQTDVEYTVRKANLKDAFELFVESHPELRPENDTNNTKYSQLKEFFKVSKNDISVRDFMKKLTGAYAAAFPEAVITAAREEGKTEALKAKMGETQIGETTSVRTSSGETITLTKSEREAAQRHPGGITGYVKSKQAIAENKTDGKGYFDLISPKK